MIRKLASITFILAGALGPAGCMSRDEAPSPVRVLAKVNGTSISLPLVESASAGASATAPASAPAMRKSLEQAIDRELLVQQALNAKLDRDPRVAAEIDAARRQVLAKAWLDLAARRDGRVPRDEVGRFYTENPALFAQRRIYRFQELLVFAESAQLRDKLELIQGELAGARDLEEVAGWLKWRNLKISPVTSVTQAAEQLPLSHLPRLASMKEGEIAVLPSPLGASVVRLVAAQDAPLGREHAAPLIEQFLAGRKRLELAAAEVRKLREAASIEYAGEFKGNHR